MSFLCRMCIYHPAYKVSWSLILLTLFCFFSFQMALIYMCTRLTLNVSSSYFVLYLTETMNFEKVGNYFSSMSLFKTAKQDY